MDYEHIKEIPLHPLISDNYKLFLCKQNFNFIVQNRFKTMRIDRTEYL